MATPGVIMMILAAYLIFVLKIGPDFMRKREAFKLTKVLIIYNAVQVIASAFLVQYVSQTKLKFYKTIYLKNTANKTNSAVY